MTPGIVREIESIRTLTLLGIRFWDDVLDAQVRGGLYVTARPLNAFSTRPRVQAFRTRSDIYAFSHLPGLDEYERGRRDPFTEASPSERRPFIVEVSDTQGRYLDLAFVIELPLPYRGVFLSAGTTSPPLPPAGFFLYSAATRMQPSWLAAVRGQLIDQSTGGVAAYAVVQAEDPDGDRWFGISDSEGKFVVFLPYPTIAEGFAGSPLVGGETPLLERTWELEISVRYSPSSRQPLPYTDIPDYYSILSQTGGRVWPIAPANAGATQPEMTGTLEYGRVLTVRTEGISELMVSAEPTSP